jgi:phage tail sheath protein FI
MANHGVFVTEQATSIGAPVVAASGVPFVIGTAPVQSAEDPAALGVPVRITGWNEFRKRFGYADDWAKYTLCEYAFVHFALYAMQPVIFVNLLDPATHKEAVAAADISVVNHRITLPKEAIDSAALVIKAETGTGTAYIKGTDYEVFYTDAACIVEILSTSAAYSAAKLNVAYNQVKPSLVDATAVATGMESIELCATTLGIVPDLIVAPVYSEENAVAAVMAAKAGGINGLFRAKALIDVPSGSGDAEAYSGVLTYKNTNALTDENQILCWPKVTFGGKTYHMSCHLAALIAANDTQFGAPYVSPSNKTLMIDGLVNGAGAEINLTLAQANILNAAGIVTALNFMGGWKAWGNYTACYPVASDVKDILIPVSRMFDWVGNTVVQTCWSYIDQPMNRRTVDNILDTINIWLNGLVGSGYLLGARVEMPEDENPVTNLMQGIVKFHLYITPPSPAQEINFTLEYDVNYLTEAFQ